LANLLKGNKPSAPGSEPGESPSKHSPAVARLLRGAQEPPEAESKPANTTEAEPQPKASARKRWVRVALVAADVLLVAVAIRLVAKGHAPLGAFDALLCVLAFGIGAALTCLAFWWD
jgi:hypothetical protein